MKEKTFYKKMDDIRKNAAYRAVSLPGRKVKKLSETAGKAAAKGVKKFIKHSRAQSQKKIDYERKRNQDIIERNWGTVENYEKMKAGYKKKKNDEGKIKKTKPSKKLPYGKRKKKLPYKVKSVKPLKKVIRKKFNRTKKK